MRRDVRHRSNSRPQGRRFFGLLTVFALLAIGCGANGDDGPSSDGSEAGRESEAASTEPTESDYDTDAVLTFFATSGNNTLDPIEPQNNSSLSQEALMVLYDTLVFLDHDGELQPGLATSWEYNDDLTELTMVLRDDVVFHDGEDFNADVVVANIERSRGAGEVGANTSATLEMISAVEAIDDHTVRFTMTEPTGQLEYFLGQQAGMMLSPSVVEDGNYGADIDPIGSGPYSLVSYDANVLVEYERFDDYWGGSEGRPAGFEHRYVPDGNARLNAVRSGEATLAIIGANQIPEAEAADLDLMMLPDLGLWGIYTNLTRETTGDLRIRQAMMHAVDRQALVDAVMYGSAEPTQQPFPPGYFLYDDGLDEAYAYDPERARELVAEAGYPDGVDIEWLLLNTTEYVQLAESIQAMMAEANINIEFTTIDLSQGYTYSDEGAGDIMMARFGGRADPLQTFQELVWSDGTQTHEEAASPLIDDLVERIMALTPDDPERLAALDELNQEVVEQVAYVPLTTRSNVYVARPDCIEGLRPYLPAGSEYLNDVRILKDCQPS